jgi:hypothetical protein
MHRSSILIAAAALAGCAGAFQQAALFQECRTGDATCSRVAPTAPLAVGAHLRPNVAVDLPGSATPIVRVASGRPDILDDRGPELIGVRPGVAPVLITADDGTVIDFEHVWVAAPTRLVALAADERTATGEEVSRPIQLVVGESRWLTPAIYGGAQRLAGTGDVTWQVACAAPTCGAVALLTDGTPDRQRLVARAPGAVQVSVVGLGLTTTIEVEVVP